MRRQLLDAVAEAIVKPLKKPTLRRFTWCRIHHELLRKPLWRLVARMAGAPLPYVKLLVVELDLYASENTPRGSVEGFNVAALAADWGLAGDDQLARIYLALEHPEVGWLDQDFIVTFWDRNPDVEDATAAERMRRMRARKKAAKEAARAARETPYPQSRVTHRNAVTVTTRSDQIKQQAGGISEQEQGESGAAAGTSQAASVEAVHSNSGESGDHLADAEVWLAFEGKRIVSERCKWLPSRAWMEITRWRKELLDDVAALAAMIHDGDTMGLAGGKFTDRIRDRIIAYCYEEKGPALPMPPAVVRKTGGHHG